jgi:hypothetical protein
MDREKRKAGKFDWLPAQMPGVARVLADKRRELGAEWVNECWKRGVVQREPGWFFAGEGALMVGTLWEDAQAIVFAAGKMPADAAVVILKPKEAANGAQ